MDGVLIIRQYVAEFIENQRRFASFEGPVSWESVAGAHCIANYQMVHLRCKLDPVVNSLQ